MYSYTDHYTALAKWQRVARHLGISMSLMSDEHVRGTYLDSSSYPPASTEKERSSNRRDFFQTKFNGDILGTDLAMWLGVAWHELGHVLWTPYTEHFIITTGLNLLEDARTEALTILKYPRTRNPLLVALSRLYAEMGDADARFEYAFVAGRLHLPVEIRQASRQKLVEAGEGDIADRIDDIYDRYLQMGKVVNTGKAMSIAAELDDILGTTPLDYATCRGAQIGGSEGGKNDTSVTQEVLDDMLSQLEEDRKGSGSGSTTDNSYGTARKIRDAAEEDGTLAQEVEDLRKTLTGPAHFGSLNNDLDNFTTPSGGNVELARKVREAAIRFNDDSGKGVVRRQDHGRLRPMRYEKYEDIESAYDVWEPGLEQEMYVMLVLDSSGSMSTTEVTSVAYALQVGLSEIAEVDMVTFGDEMRVPTRKSSATVQVTINCQGGTCPTGAVAYAYTKMMVAPQANKLCVFFTDGTFNGTGEYNAVNQYVGEMKARGFNVRFVGSNGEANRLRSLLTNLGKNDLTAGNSVSELPAIVLDWTRTVLTGGI